MEISSNRTYSNIIYSAIIVNDNSDMDPESKGRVQIYIPSVHLSQIDTYTDYMTSSNKREHDGWTIFPWATTLVDDLKNGNVVFGSNVDNKANEYIILGLDINNSSNSKGAGSGLDLGSAETSGVLDLAMPIILHNEVGINVNQWPNDIPTSSYTNINPYDKGCTCKDKSKCAHSGGWSIGLIQWHHCRAFDCLYQIAKADSNWQSKVNMKQDLFKDLSNAVSKNSTTGYRTKYQENFHPINGTAAYSGIQALLGSDIGKETQRKYASEDTASSIDTLIQEPNCINNPAILIFMADLMNQYGPGLTNTIKKAVNINKTNDDIMEQLSQLRDWCKSNFSDYNKYINRRNTTYTYIENLYNAGKLTTLGGKNLADAEGANKGGQLLWPSPGCQVVTSKYGYRTYYSTKQNRWVSDFHTGVDLARNGGALGQEIIAAHSGTVTIQDSSGGYGILTKITNGEMTTYYAHQCKRETGIKNGVTVQAGQVIGYVGNTGNSSGAHLHFEVRINNQHKNPLPYIKKS